MIHLRCEVCELSKAKSIISRRSMRKDMQPFEVLHIIDLIDINPSAFIGDKWQFHAILMQQSFIFQCQGKAKEFYQKASRQSSILSSKFHMEGSLWPRSTLTRIRCLKVEGVQTWAYNEGIIIISSALYAHEQNGKAERAGRTSSRWQDRYA